MQNRTGSMSLVKERKKREGKKKKGKKKPCQAMPKLV